VNDVNPSQAFYIAQTKHGGAIMNRRWNSLILALSLLLLGGILPAAPAAAQNDQRCFAETNLCISGPIRRYWEQNGGLAVFGYPITTQRREQAEDRMLDVQWFERDRLEIQADGTITAGRLGARMLELQGRPWNLTPNRGQPQANCRYFAITGYNLCGVFLRYWERNGGLERFGYPISAPRFETIDGWSGEVQYFERRRMEHHTDLAGTPYEVLLGLLGNRTLELQIDPACADPLRTVQFDLEQRIGSVAFRSDLLCPTSSHFNLPASVQYFENGAMFWFDLGYARKIVVVRNAGHPAPYPTYSVFDDTYQEGDPPIPGTPPPGRYIPQRGFGKIWAGSRGQGQWLGLGISPEIPERMAVQYFGRGGFAFQLLDSGAVWVFGPNMAQLAQS
jgi:hypothetical protein